MGLLLGYIFVNIIIYYLLVNNSKKFRIAPALHAAVFFVVLAFVMLVQDGPGAGLAKALVGEQHYLTIHEILTYTGITSVAMVLEVIVCALAAVVAVILAVKAVKYVRTKRKAAAVHKSFHKRPYCFNAVSAVLVNKKYLVDCSLRC